MRPEHGAWMIFLVHTAACIEGTDGKGPGDTSEPDDSHAETGHSGETDSPDDTGHSGDTDDTNDSVDTAPIDTGTRADADGDGYYANEDCDDSDPSVNPGAEEVWDDGVDQDCDGDDACDSDGDGFDREECGGDDCDDHDTDLTAEDDVDELALGVGPVCGTAHVSAVLFGEEKGDRVGGDESGADINGDGLSDILVGNSRDSRYGTYSGVGYIMLSPLVGEVELADSDAMLVGSADYAYVGSMYGLGDNDGDGYDDLVTSPGVDGVNVPNVFQGPLSGERAAESGDATFSAGDTSVGARPAGDVDGDGLADVLASAAASSTSGESSVAYLLTGALSGTYTESDVTATIRSTSTGDYCVAISAGDTNADGLADILLNCLFAESSYLFVDSRVGDLSTMDAESSWTFSDGAVAKRGADVDGDGCDDILFNDQAIESSEGDPYAGAAWLYLGPFASGEVLSTDWYASWEGQEANDALAVFAAGSDINADGFDDFLLRTESDEVSNVYYQRMVLAVTPGSHTLSDAGWTVMPEPKPFGYLYSSVVGDTNGDGFTDLTFAESTWGSDSTDSGSGEGAVWLFLGGEF